MLCRSLKISKGAGRMKVIHGLNLMLTILLAFVIYIGFIHHGQFRNLVPVAGNESASLKLDEAGAGLHSEKQVTLQKKQTPTQKSIATFAAIGDILLHKRVYSTAVDKEGNYDFSEAFQRIIPMLEAPDLTMANSESIIGGAELGLSTYPAFNSPHEVGDIMKESGIDVVSMANNHALDKGEAGVRGAVQYWDSIGVEHTGAALSKKERDTLPVVERNGISFAFAAFTYGTNGYRPPPGKGYLVNYLDKAAVKQAIAAAKSVADVAVISLHFGNEYERLPNAFQQEWVQFAADAGADIIVGHHPHVLQPPAWITGKNGNKAFAIYSLGNFYSGQEGLYKQIGGMVQVEVEKAERPDGTKSLTLRNPHFTPTYVERGRDQKYRILPLESVTEGQLPGAAGVFKEIQEHMSRWITDLTF